MLLGGFRRFISWKDQQEGEDPIPSGWCFPALTWTWRGLKERAIFLPAFPHSFLVRSSTLQPLLHIPSLTLELQSYNVEPYSTLGLRSRLTLLWHAALSTKHIPYSQLFQGEMAMIEILSPYCTANHLNTFPFQFTLTLLVGSTRET